MNLAAALALCAALNAAAPRRPAASARLSLSPEAAVQTAGLFSLGMRRLAADLELVRLLIYYGTPESRGGEEHGHRHGTGWGEAEFGGGRYPEIASRARRILELDPSFVYAAQYASGALAFNLQRPDEALELLAFAIARDPGSTTLRSYAAAVGVSKTGDAKKAAALLEPALADPQCPTMIKSMAAFMYRRVENRKRAAELYRDILATSRDWGYRSVARRSLDELGEP